MTIIETVFYAIGSIALVLLVSWVLLGGLQ